MGVEAPPHMLTSLSLPPVSPRRSASRRLYLTGGRAVRYKEYVTSGPPTTYHLSRRLNVPLAAITPTKGGRATRRSPSETVPAVPRSS